ncbi:MAG: carboxypeptidase-like regulatory domain-containing protein [Polyangiaceae bacterium]
MSIQTRRDASKRFAFVAPIAFVGAMLMAACGSSSNTDSTVDGGDGGGHDGAGDFDSCASPSCDDPCANLGCASMAGPLLIRVLDSNGTPIPSPSFYADSRSVAEPAVCETDAGQILEDAGSCDPWTIDTLGPGSHSLMISAVGYKSVFTNVTLNGPSGCCGIGPATDATITLQSAADASDDG